jgi:hypothetical protein
MEQEAMIRAANEASEKPPKPYLARVPVVAIVALLFSTVVAHNVRAWTPDPVDQTVALQDRADQVSLLVAAQRIEAFRREEGRLPASLEEAGLADDAYEYRVDGTRYELRLAEEGGGQEVYESETGPEALVRRLAEPLPEDG